MQAQVLLNQDLLFLPDLPGREPDPIRDQMPPGNIRNDRTGITPDQLNQDLLILQDHPGREAVNQVAMHAGQALQDQAPAGPVNQGDMAASQTANPVVGLLLMIPRGEG